MPPQGRCQKLTFLASPAAWVQPWQLCLRNSKEAREVDVGTEVQTGRGVHMEPGSWGGMEASFEPRCTGSLNVSPSLVHGPRCRRLQWQEEKEKLRKKSWGQLASHPEAQFSRLPATCYNPDLALSFISMGSQQPYKAGWANQDLEKSSKLLDVTQKRSQYTLLPTRRPTEDVWAYVWLSDHTLSNLGSGSTSETFFHFQTKARALHMVGPQ